MRKIILTGILIANVLLIVQQGSQASDVQNGHAPGPLITNITTNGADYPNNQIPKYDKFKVTFQVENSVAGNFQLPYDPDPPPGIDLTYSKHQGISVDALFLPPEETAWSNAYHQPAFYYQHFEEQIKPDEKGRAREWFYPTGDFSWKVRFSPNQPGIWRFKLKAQDAGGYTETTAQPFTVTDSAGQGFIKVSAIEPRYFEFDEGLPFHGVGFQYSGGGVFSNPRLESEPDFQTFRRNNVKLLRIWISNIYGAAWLNYLGGRNIYDGYLPRSGIVPFYDSTRDRTTLALRLDYEPEGNVGRFDACRFQFWDAPEAVNQNTTYRLRIKYRGIDITGPRNPAYPDYGFVGKVGGRHADCHEPGTSAVVTNYGSNNSDWQYLDGVWQSGSHNFLPRLHLALENVTGGQVYVDSVSIREQLDTGRYGPEIKIEPSLEYELYYPQHWSHALDKVVDLAGQHNIYLKLVLSDKDDAIYSKIEDGGDFVTGPDNVDGFYGVGRMVNKTRWLQQAWWRYLQARWGYSPHIHSWELTNEGDPFDENHYALADELGKFMHCRVFGVPVGPGDGAKCAYDHPNDHMATTSFWQWFPADQFWANPAYPNVDYADVHAYVRTGWLNDPAYETDAAAYHLGYSANTRRILDRAAGRNDIPPKPIVRGEAGLGFLDEPGEHPDLARDTQGVWLHNYIWATLHPGALHEIYWWDSNRETQPGPDGQPGLYEIYGPFHNFINPIPLNNGHYQAVNASVNHPNLRVVGQKDLVNQNGHLWLQNKQHTWRNVVDDVPISPISGTVVIPGFQANQTYIIQWWDTYDIGRRIERTQIITAQSNGDIDLTISDLVDDRAVKILAGQGPDYSNRLYLPLILKE